MINVLTLGANGVLGTEITKQLEQIDNINQLCYDIRQISYERRNGRNICADVCDRSELSAAVKGQDFIVCSLNGDWLGQARALVSVLDPAHSPRIIWVTGMGIHNEVAGIHGLVWRKYASIYPDYIEAADLIASCGAPYTLIRTADLTEDGDASYHLHRAGQRAHSRYVSRSAVAKLITEIILSPDDFGLNESLGITD